MNELKNVEMSPEISYYKDRMPFSLDEKSMERLQKLAVQFKNGKISDEEKNEMNKLAKDYISHEHVGNHGYYADSPSKDTSYTEYSFYDLPNGLCLEAEAGNHDNTFHFSEVLTAEERDKKIAYLKSMAEGKE